MPSTGKSILIGKGGETDTESLRGFTIAAYGQKN